MRPLAPISFLWLIQGSLDGRGENGQARKSCILLRGVLQKFGRFLYISGAPKATEMTQYAIERSDLPIFATLFRFSPRLLFCMQFWFEERVIL